MKILTWLVLLLVPLGCTVHKSDKTDLGIWQRECISNQDKLITNTFHSSLFYSHRKTKRCEIATHDLIKMNDPFELSFIFSTDHIEKNDPEWHLIFQIHSFPDTGEEWRCPVLSLEVIEGTLRMTNRWDANKISSLVDGTCASPKNSIKSREVFLDYALEPNTKYEIKIIGKLAIDDSGMLEARINNEVLDSHEGPNTFNDKRGPYIKFGIYKPTWWEYKKTLSYQYLDFVFKGDKAWK